MRANHPVPSDCPLYYFEIDIVNKGRCGTAVCSCTACWQRGLQGQVYLQCQPSNLLLSF